MSRTEVDFHKFDPPITLGFIFKDIGGSAHTWEECKDVLATGGSETEVL